MDLRSEHEANLELVEPKSVPSWMDPAPKRDYQNKDESKSLPGGLKVVLTVFYGIALAAGVNSAIELAVMGSIISPIDEALLFVIKSVVVMVSVALVGFISLLFSVPD